MYILFSALLLKIPCVKYLLTVYAEALALMLSMIRAESNKTFAFPHKLSTALQRNECIFVHPLLFKYASKRSRCLIEHYNLKMFVDKTR